MTIADKISSSLKILSCIDFYLVREMCSQPGILFYYRLAVVGYGFQVLKAKFYGFFGKRRVVYGGCRALHAVAEHVLHQCHGRLCLREASVGIVLFLVDEQPSEAADRICSFCRRVGYRAVSPAAAEMLSVDGLISSPRLLYTLA